MPRQSAAIPQDRDIIVRNVIAVWIFVSLLLFTGEVFGAGKVTMSPKTLSVGEIALVSLGGLNLKPGEVVWAKFFDRSFPLIADDNGTLSGFVAADRDAKTGAHPYRVYTSLVAGAPLLYKGEIKVKGRKFVEQHLKVDQKTVELSPVDLERAIAEREIINAALSGRSSSYLWEGAFLRPVPGTVSSTFGLKRFYNGKPGSYHGGLDIAAPKGEPVKASQRGKVVLAGNYFYTGNTVFIDHGLGLFTAYFHMEELDVENGEEVKPGDILGKVGSTGRSTGPHLHWSVYLCGVKVDPESLMAATK